MIGSRWALGLSACLVLSVAGQAQEFKPEDGYTSLFNGKDLTGWRYAKEDLKGKTETGDKRFTVKDGAIVAEDGKGIKDLYTIPEFNGPFHLKMEFRAAAKADSGVYIRGPQLQVRDFIRRGEQKALEKVFKNDDWNELDITVSAPTMTATVNGAAVKPGESLELTFKDGKTTAKLDGKEVVVKALTMSVGATAVCKLNGVQFDPNYKPGANGGIGVQAETGKFEFRRIRIKEMK